MTTLPLESGLPYEQPATETPAEILHALEEEYASHQANRPDMLAPVAEQLAWVIRIAELGGKVDMLHKLTGPHEVPVQRID